MVNSSEKRDTASHEQRVGDPTQDTAAAARALAILFAAGAALTLIAVLVPNRQSSYELGIGIAPVLAFAIGALLFLRAKTLPRWVVPAVAASGTILISFGLYWSDRGTGAFAFLYIWVGIYSAYFLSRAEAALEVLVVAGAYAAVLFSQQSVGAKQQSWLIVIGTIGVTMWLVWHLTSRVELLISRLADTARTDPLTGLMNRRGFQELIEVEVERAFRGDRPFSVVLCDLDHFKQVNDRLGHQAGDEALKRVARAIEAGKRSIDVAIRMGGEEFAVLLPDTDGQGAYVLAERVRGSIQKEFANDPVPLTISLGVATYPKDAPTPDGLLGVADQALYGAKQLGRDRTVIYSSELRVSLADLMGQGERQKEADLATVLALAEALDIRDIGTSEHSKTVSRYATEIAMALGLPPARVERVRFAGIVHDVGKIGVADAILNKPGPLNEEEWEAMRGHPEIGARIIAGKDLDDIRAWVLAHHEQPDGGGYPFGLRDEQIPLEAKILAVADAYEAMMADRVYRPSLGSEKALAELELGAGTQFDADVVAAFAGVLEQANTKPDTPASDPQPRTALTAVDARPTRSIGPPVSDAA